MDKESASACPRCGRQFSCRPHDIEHCTCAAVEVSAAVLQRISIVFTCCLCSDCLTALASGAEEDLIAPARVQQRRFPG